MSPLLRALGNRLWNEPVFFLTALAAVSPVVKDALSLPGWTVALGLVLYGIAVRASVKPVNPK